MGQHRRETIVAVTAHDRAWARGQFAGLSPRVLVIHAGAQWETKRWPAGHFAFVAAKAARYYKMSPVLVGSPAERTLTDHIERQVRKFVPNARLKNLAGQTTLKRLAAVLERADVVLSNDSGPMHLAAGVGTPVVGVFTCTSPVQSGPPGKQHALVSTRLDCAAGYHKHCPHRGGRRLACFRELEADRVWQALADLVESQFRRAA